MHKLSGTNPNSTIYNQKVLRNNDTERMNWRTRSSMEVWTMIKRRPNVGEYEFNHLKELENAMKVEWEAMKNHA